MIKRAQPSLSVPEVLKVLGEMWRRVNPTEKEKYEARARLRRKQFDGAMDKWKAETSEEERKALDVAKREEKLKKEKAENLAKQKREKKLLLEELGQPKKPLTTFFLYMQEQKALKNRTATGAAMKQKDFISSCVEKYKKLTPAETQILKTRYEANKKSYEAAIEIWNKKMTQDGKITNLQKS